MNEVNLKNKKILVTGGSGSLGRYLIADLLKKGARQIYSLSRDEGLIKNAREFVNSDLVTFVIGDINDPQRLKNISKDMNIIFHAAAMKDVVFAEHNPREILKNNILGTLNLLDYSENVENFINISSDKAIGVINCYGASKLLSEYLVSETNQFSKGNYLNVRCPNFLGSRGSVIDVWKNQVRERNEIIVTDPTMTRFFITLPEAASFIVDLGLQKKLKTDHIYYPFRQTKKFLLQDLAEAFISFYPDKKIKLKILGKRTGEKVHEDYVTKIPLLKVDALKILLIPLMK